MVLLHVVEEKAVSIRVLFLDVDGVLTDGRIVIKDGGEETKCFDVKDGQGLKMLMAGGVEVAIISGRKSRSLEHRARDLGIKDVYQGVKDKRALCSKLMKGKGVKKEEVCCIGDDFPDFAMFREAGLRIAVADAVKELREKADFITRNKGGSGAVREVCEWILKCQGKWRSALADFTGK